MFKKTLEETDYENLHISKLVKRCEGRAKYKGDIIYDYAKEYITWLTKKEMKLPEFV